MILSQSKKQTQFKPNSNPILSAAGGFERRVHSWTAGITKNI